MGDWTADAEGSLTTIATYTDDSCAGGFIMSVAYNQAGAGSSAWGTANLIGYYPFLCITPFLVQRVFWGNGATVSGNVDVGVYNTDGVLLLNAGSTAQATINVAQSVALGTPYLLTPDLYYFGVAASSATATFVGSGVGTPDFMQHFGMGQQSAAPPLPATWTFASASTSTLIVPYAGVTNRTLI